MTIIGLSVVSCHQEPELELTFHEKLEQFIKDSDRVILINTSDISQFENYRTASELNNISSQISFEILDEEVIPEIRTFFNRYGESNFDFDAFLSFRNSSNSNARLETSCRETWTHTIYSIGGEYLGESMRVCSDCFSDGVWRCYSYVWQM